MSKSLSTITNAVIESYGNTALNLISAYRAGGERIIGFVDQRFESAVETGAARLSDEMRANLIDGQKRISGYYARGLQFGTDRAESVVHSAVDFANKGVDRMAANAERFDQATKLGALEAINRVAVPAAQAVSQVVARIEEGSGELVKRVAGQPAAVKAVVKQAKAVRKSVSKSATKTVKKAAATKKAVVRKAGATVRKARSAVAQAAA